MSKQYFKLTNCGLSFTTSFGDGYLQGDGNIVLHGSSIQPELAGLICIHLLANAQLNVDAAQPVCNRLSRVVIGTIESCAEKWVRDLWPFNSPELIAGLLSSINLDGGDWARVVERLSSYSALRTHQTPRVNYEN